MKRQKLITRSAIVLAGGFSTRFGEDKGILKLANKPLIEHVTDSVQKIVDEIIVVTSSKQRVLDYAGFLTPSTKFAVDLYDSKSPLMGALTGFNAAEGEYSLLLPFDTPFISGEVISLLFNLCEKKAATIPRWPNSQIEPLHAVYRTRLALRAAESAMAEGRLDVRAMIEKLHGVRYVSTLLIQQIDSKFDTFFNINTPADLRRAILKMDPENQR